MIKSKLPSVDILLTQFSYAHKVENSEDVSLRLKKIEEKVERIKNQNLVFQPKYIIPFASYVYFCHEENFYMNPPNFPLRKIVDFIQIELNKNCIVYNSPQI